MRRLHVLAGLLAVALLAIAAVAIFAGGNAGAIATLGALGGALIGMIMGERQRR